MYCVNRHTLVLLVLEEEEGEEVKEAKEVDVMILWKC
jgi:hypothetical protein